MSDATSGTWGDMLPAETDSTLETISLGIRLGRMLGAGDVVAFYGDLGAGKTHLIKGICSAFGIPEKRVTSPTFTLVNEYTQGPFPVYHVDAYRIRHPGELAQIGFESTIEGDGLCLIEWPERIEEALPPDTIRLRLTHLGGDRRRVALVQQ